MRRSSLKLPITLAVIMIILLVVLIVGWILTMFFAAIDRNSHSWMYWTFLPIGSVFLSLILAGTITYLVLSIKIINLNRRQSNFISSVTHELKSPLASLKLCLQTLTRYDVAPEQKLKFYSGMMEEVERLDVLINQVLRAGQLEAGLQIGEQAEEIVVREMLESAIHSASIRHRIDETQIQVDCNENYRMITSRIPFEMIFRNLIDNAIKYGGEPPCVEVRVRKISTSKIAIRVTDNGRGIPKKMRKKIFERFVRLGTELERRRKGTGLGLYIVRMCLSQLSGDIRVRENKHGPGTSFYVLLPVNTTLNSKMKLEEVE